MLWIDCLPAICTFPACFCESLIQQQCGLRMHPCSLNCYAIKSNDHQVSLVHSPQLSRAHSGKQSHTNANWNNSWKLSPTRFMWDKKLQKKRMHVRASHLGREICKSKSVPRSARRMRQSGTSLSAAVKPRFQSASFGLTITRERFPPKLTEALHARPADQLCK